MPVTPKPGKKGASGKKKYSLTGKASGPSSIEIPEELLRLAEQYDYWQDATDREGYGTASFYQIKSSGDYERVLEFAVNTVRATDSYKRYIKFMRAHPDWNKSRALANLEPGSVTIELHHHPITMFDLCDVFSRFILQQGGRYSVELIAHEVIKAHYANPQIVGVVPLPTTTHQLFHNGMYHIVPEEIEQDVHLFFQQYNSVLPQRVRKKFQKFFTMDRAEAHARNAAILSHTQVDLKTI